MNYISLIFVMLLWHTKESHAAKETNKMDTFERKLSEFETVLASLSGRLSTVDDKLESMIDSFNSLDQCKDCDEQPTCERYRGRVCSTHIGNRSIYSNITRKDMFHKEESITAALTLLTGLMSASDECMQYLIPSLCIFNFPQCELETMFDVRRMCRDECEMLVNTTCKDVYKLSQYYFAVRYLLPKCDTLQHDNTHCVRIGLISDGSHDETPAKLMLPVLELTIRGMMARAVNLSWIDPTLDDTQTVTDGRYYTIRYTAIPKTKKYSKMRVKETMVKIDELQPNTTYEFSVRVSNNGLKSKWSKSVTHKTNQLTEVTTWSAPRNVRARVKDSQFVVVEWDAPELITGDLEGYKVFFTHDPQRPVSLWQQEVIKDNKTSVVVEPERPTTTNYFSVMALSSTFGQSPMSDPVKLNRIEAVFTAWSAPRNVRARVKDSPQFVVVEWDPPNDASTRDIQGYKVYFTHDPQRPVSLWQQEAIRDNKTSVVVEPERPTTTNYFSVVALAHDSYQSPMSEPVKLTPKEAVFTGSSAPRNVRARVKDSQFVVIEWDPPVDLSTADIQGYKVYFTHDPQRPVSLWQQEVIRDNKTSVVVEPERPTTTNYFSVVALAHDSYQSPMSEPVKLTPKEAGGYPLKLTVKSLHDDPSSVLVSWQLTGQWTNFRFNDWTNKGNIPFQRIAGTTVNSAYVVYYTTDPSLNDTKWALEGVNGDQTSVKIEHLIPGETYYFKLRTLTIGKGYGPISPSVEYQHTERSFPGPPRNVRARARDQHTIIVEWDEPELSNGDIEGYRVTLISLPEPGRPPNIVSSQFEVRGENTSLTVSSLKANTTYYISVLAFSDVGHGPASEAVEAVTKSEAPQTYPPNLAVIGVNGEPGTVLVTWEPPESVIPIYEYLIYYTTIPDRPFGYWLISIVKGDILSTQIYDLTPGETYYFTIKAVNAKGIGPMSPPVSYENP